MYVKFGSIYSVKYVFNFIDWYSDIVIWIFMIIVLVQYGLGEEVIELFEKMLICGINFDYIIYVGVFVVCIYVGLVEKGKSFYNMMKNVY